MRKFFKMSFLFAAAAAIGLGAAKSAVAAPNVPFNGSGIESSSTILAGHTVTFQYDLVTASNTAPAGSQDFAYFTFNGQPVQVLATENSATIANSDVFSGGFQTGYKTFTFTAGSNGTLGFGVVNVNTGTVGTALLLANLKDNGNLITNGDFGALPDFASGFSSVVGNATVQGDLGSIFAPGGTQAVLANTNLFPVGVNSAQFPLAGAPVGIAALETATNVPSGGLSTLALQVNAAAVPLPTGMYLAPLGLILAGVYSRKLRRSAAC